MIKILLFIFVFAGDILYLKNGEELRGKLLYLDSANVEFLAEGDTIEISIDSVTSIDLSKRREGDEWERAEDITDSVLKKTLKEDVSKYTYANYVNLFVETHIKIKSDSSYILRKRVIRKILTEQGKVSANVIYPYLSSNENADVLFARTVSRDGRVISIRDNAIEKMIAYSSVPQYQNLSYLKFALPAAEVGAITDFCIVKKGKPDEEHPVEFEILMGDKEPVIESRLIIETELPVNYQTFRMGKPKIFEKGEKKIYIFEIKEYKGIFKEPSMPKLSRILPKVIVALKTDWQTLAKKFRERIGEIKKEKKRKAKDIYYEVLKKIKYINISSRNYKVYPKNVDEILKEKAGNGLDKAFLLYYKLRKAGYDADLILCRRKCKGDLAEKVPSLLQFTSAIVKLGDVYLNPEDDVIKFGYIKPCYQGTKGLSINEGEIVEIPLMNENAEKVEDIKKVKLDEKGDAEIFEEIYLNGETEAEIRKWKELYPEEVKKRVENLINEVFPGAELLDYKITDFENFNKKMRIKLKYHAKDVAKIAGDYMLLKLPGIKYSARDVGIEKRKYPFKIGRKIKEINRIEIILPEGYKIEALPENVKINTKIGSYEARFKKGKNKLIFEDEYFINTDFIDTLDYADFKRLKEMMANLSDKWLFLKK